MLFIVAFLTPISVNFTFFYAASPVDFSVLTEPFLLFMLLILTFKFSLSREINLPILKHPLTVAVLFNLSWIFITALLSTMPLVSLKFFVVRSWFVFPVFLFGIIVFKNYRNIKPFIWVYGITLLFVVIYSTIGLMHTGMLARNAAHFVVKPFYNDHTAYGAILGFITPVFYGLATNKKYKPLYRLIALFFAIAFTVGTLLSYSRASWLGLFFALGIFIIVKLRIRFIYIFTVVLIVGAFVFAFWFQILDMLGKNKQDSSNNIMQQVESISNIETDASNLERLNRWHCAIEMFKQKPLTGWGPGTYQFQYAPFQLQRMRTIISTDFGDIGNAHSEYLGPLAEQGVLGMLSFIFIVIALIYTGFKVYYKAKDSEVKNLALSITLGFVTYFFHGTMNNFLDTDKLAVPFFGLAAILVALDLFHKEEKI